ncbi:restriction endonuclease [Roseateles sp. UC29_93]|uniref:restriction endonuclease n=1 Tax=Roseateles sp. UC29_93 TaxID=3350177 RepID=UPI00366F1FF4
MNARSRADNAATILGGRLQGESQNGQKKEEILGRGSARSIRVAAVVGECGARGRRILRAHALAGLPPAKPQAGPFARQFQTLVANAGVRGAAGGLQYALPMLLLVASVMSAFRRHARRDLLQASALNQDAAAIDGMTWHQFELLIGEAFRQKGYTVVEIGGNGPDGGVDLVLRKPATNGNETFLVQCKHWKAFKVSVNVVRELYGVMAARGAAGGFVVTSGRFTSEAVVFAEGRNVELIDGTRLKELLASAKVEPHLPPAPTASKPSDLPTMVVCPSCLHPLVRRIAKRGPQAGQAFYGCSTYPVCKYTRAL